MGLAKEQFIAASISLMVLVAMFQLTAVASGSNGAKCRIQTCGP